MRHILIVLTVLLFGTSCKEKVTPKPRGYFRINFSEKNYQPIPGHFPYQFDIPDYSHIVPDQQNPDHPWWINLEIPNNKAEIHLSYFTLHSTTTGSNRKLLAELMEETRELAYKHSIKANAIQEQVFVNPGHHVYGTVYRISGNAASPMQFFLTDSTNHFLRGALYIRATPDIDSLKPVIDFLE
ncbi:MAG: gliding motility lipoprotein GldD, partial [Mariniphaga sp.]|nr:gliding motility lipoprotein GldD [Mariniphaga sp.]